MESAASALRFFKYDHLPPRLQRVSAPFGLVAQWLATLPDTAQTRLAAQKLIEAKDCAVRACVDHPEHRVALFGPPVQLRGEGGAGDGASTDGGASGSNG